MFVQDCFGGADPEYRLPVRVITETAWHSLFARTMFLKPESLDACKKHVPEFTIIAAPGFNASPLIDSTRTETFIILHLAERLAIIGGTCYGGEIKKTVFTVLNALLPFDGVLPMHCSANVGDGWRRGHLLRPIRNRQDDTRRPTRRASLVGDDEHGWSDNGVFNFEDGCYAKVIRPLGKAEPKIYSCTQALRHDSRKRGLRSAHAQVSI